MASALKTISRIVLNISLSASDNKKVGQVSQTDRDAGWVSYLAMAKRGRLEMGDNILRTL